MPSPPPRGPGLAAHPTAPAAPTPPPPTEPTATTTTTTTQTTNKPRLPVLTYHCRFCNHLLLATTRDLARLPRRKGPGIDRAVILPLPSTSTPAGEDNEVEDGGDDKRGGERHATLLLSTSLPDKKPTLVRREDGFEKRVLLRCGRCRLVMGYFLDAVHFDKTTAKREVVYLLLGALMETGVMGDESGMRALDGEWSRWID